MTQTAGTSTREIWCARYLAGGYERQQVQPLNSVRSLTQLTSQSLSQPRLGSKQPARPSSVILVALRSLKPSSGKGPNGNSPSRKFSRQRATKCCVTRPATKRGAGAATRCKTCTLGDTWCCVLCKSGFGRGWQRRRRRGQQRES